MPVTMDPKLAYELSRLDPAVPFRATSAHRHHTWAHTYHTRPELYIQPESIEEVQKLTTLARRCRRRLVVVGSAHSPSDLTCTSAWLVNLDRLDRVLSVDRAAKVMRVQAGIRLRELNRRAAEYGLTMPNLGSIDEQSVAGVMATGTHGSSLSHGLVSAAARALRLVLANGAVVRCSAAQNVDLFRAALVSLGALGIVVEVEYEMVPDVRIAWRQTIVPSAEIYAQWDGDLWTSDEFVRVWWLPYTGRSIVWKAHKVPDAPSTDAALAATASAKENPQSWYAGALGYHTYHTLLWIAHYLPPILPLVERFIFGMQYGFRTGTTTAGVEPQRAGLLMDCLYSQLVNEWSLPLSRGPEALTRLTAWLHGDLATARIPVDPAGVWVHAPLEVRVSDTRASAPHLAAAGRPRPFLDWSMCDEPSLFINATLYRPFGLEPRCAARYYEAFEHLMKELGGRPHWAKNFRTVTHGDVRGWYGEDLDAWMRVREEVDPEGMFVGAWHRRMLLGPADAEAGEAAGKYVVPRLPLEEREVERWARKGGRAARWAEKVGVAEVGERFGGHGGWEWRGEVGGESGRRTPVPRTSGRAVVPSASPVYSEESFDAVVAAEAEASTMFSSMSSLKDEEGSETDKAE